MYLGGTGAGKDSRCGAEEGSGTGEGLGVESVDATGSICWILYFWICARIAS